MRRAEWSDNSFGLVIEANAPDAGLRTRTFVALDGSMLRDLDEQIVEALDPGHLEDGAVVDERDLDELRAERLHLLGVNEELRASNGELTATVDALRRELEQVNEYRRAMLTSDSHRQLAASRRRNRVLRAAVRRQRDEIEALRAQLARRKAAITKLEECRRWEATSMQLLVLAVNRALLFLEKGPRDEAAPRLALALRSHGERLLPRDEDAPAKHIDPRVTAYRYAGVARRLGWTVR